MTKKNLKKEFPSAEWKGQHCGVHAAGQYVAKTQAEWEKVWNATFSSSFPAPKAPKLPKDKMAVAIFSGQTSANVNISIDSVAEKDGALNVSWHTDAPRSMLAVMREAYFLKFVDKSDLPVTFTKTGPGNTNPAQKFGPNV